jgi:hypothetical protein
MLILTVAGILALLFGSTADTAPRDTPANPHGLVVHEWGTFSTFSGSNGVNLKFYPYDNDLPEFVHGYQIRNSKEGPKGGTISLETPVLYFYAKQAALAAVQVEFPRGTITEWYPSAARTTTKLVWKPIKILPREARVELATEKAASRYYAARETDASLLAVSAVKDNVPKAETEKFLFYRGVGSFAMPLSVRALGSGKFAVTWSVEEMKDDMILVQVQAGKIRFQPFSLERRRQFTWEADVQLPDTDASVEKLSAALVDRLMQKGLYEKEARAMVKTWRSAWFGEEGTRILYFLPDRSTHELLPLKVVPKPVSLLRVLVGRHDVLTPEREKQIDDWVVTLKRQNGRADEAGRAAEKGIGELGRYAGAAWKEAETRLKPQR